VLDTQRCISAASHVLSVRRATFKDALPEAVAFKRRELPEMVTLYCSYRNSSQLWPILEVLNSNTRTRATCQPSVVVKIIIKDLPGHKFKWYHGGSFDTLPDGLARFTGRALQKAIQLGPLGVILLDEAGEDLITAMNKNLNQPSDGFMISQLFPTK
jgi:hypothetical protein